MGNKSDLHVCGICEDILLSLNSERKQHWCATTYATNISVLKNTYDYFYTRESAILFSIGTYLYKCHMLYTFTCKVL